jgi:chromate transporter
VAVSGFSTTLRRALLAASAVLYGVKPVVIAIVLQALWALGRTAVKTKFLAVIGLLMLAAALALFGLLLIELHIPFLQHLAD